MPQTRALLRTLKKQLKAHGKTYAQLATALSLSEASVKRLFAEESFTLQRLDKACQFIGLEMDELVALMARDSPRLKQLSFAQEKSIAEDTLLLMLAVSVINGFSFDDLLRHYRISESQCVQKLAFLDRLNIIELLPRNKIKVLVAPNFRWLPNGPIQQFFLEKLQREFFTSHFDHDDENFVVLNGLLSKASIAQLRKYIQQYAHEFNQLILTDAALPLDDKLGITMVLASRRWTFELFKAYDRSN